MKEEKRLPVSILESYARPDADKVHARYEEAWNVFTRKVVVLDDDPTGVQTVHGVNVYTDWSAESLGEGMMQEDKLFFILTNSRSFTAEETQAAHRILAQRAARAAEYYNRELLLVSRGDSTLRGHYPLELEVMKDALEEETGRRIHGQILCPYFQEGGRFTIEGVHYVKEGEWLVPAGQTEFAKDRTFGYRSSHLGEYVEEKSGGRYRKEDCIHITLQLLREQKTEEILKLLLKTERFQPVIVDAIDTCDVETFAYCLLQAMKLGKEFLIRCAAAVPKVLGNSKDRTLLTKEELTEEPVEKLTGKRVKELTEKPVEERTEKPEEGTSEEYREGGSAERNAAEEKAYGGIVLIGSHVQKTSLQLEELRASGVPADFLEFDVRTCLRDGGLEEERRRLIEAAEKSMSAGRTAVIYTSRALFTKEGATREEMLKLSVEISDAVTGIIAGLTRKPKFIIAKGGITSSDVGTKALQVKKALVLGQVQPGIPVWRTGAESRFPGLSYIIFPGNVGETDTLRKIVELLA